MATVSGTIKHRHQSALPPGGHDIDVPEWNDSFVVAGGSDQQIMVRDTAKTDGWGLTTSLTLTDMTISGTMTAATINASGTVSANALTVTTSINAASLTTTGTVTAGGVSTTTLTATGAVTAASLTVSGTLVAGTFVPIGGTTSAYPALKRNAANLDIRLADDSAYTTLTARDYVTTNGQLASASGINLRLLAQGSANVYLATNGTDRWVIGPTGTCYPLADNTNQIGVAANRVASIYLGDTGIRFGDTAAFPALRRSGTELQAVLGDGSAYTTLRCADYLAVNSFQTTTATGFLSVGTPTAASGAIRLMNNQSVKWRNAANTGDIAAVTLDTSNQLVFGGPTATVLAFNGTTFYGFADGAVSLGTLSARWSSCCLAATLSIGTNPAATGVIRLANNTSIYFRDSFNSADIRGLFCGTDNLLYVGASFRPDADATYHLGSSTTRWADAFVSGFIAIGNSPAVGSVNQAIRLANNWAIAWRNNANTNDITPLTVFSDDKVYVGGATNDAGLVLRSAVGITMSNAVVITGASLTIGTNPATQGEIRLPNGAAVWGRNAANTADVRLFRISTGDVINLGFSSYPLVLAGSSLTLGPIYVEGAEITAPAAPIANGFRLYADDDGAGKTRLMVLFSSGAAQQLAIQP